MQKKKKCIKENDSIGANRSENAPWFENVNDINFDGDEDNVAGLRSRIRKEAEEHDTSLIENDIRDDDCDDFDDDC